MFLLTDTATLERKTQLKRQRFWAVRDRYTRPLYLEREQSFDDFFPLQTPFCFGVGRPRLLGRGHNTALRRRVVKIYDAAQRVVEISDALMQRRR